MVLGNKKFSTTAYHPLVFDVIIPSELSLETVPSLVLFINPETFNQGYSKIKNVYQTLEGIVEEHYGDELDTLSCSGSTAGFYSKDDGLTHILRKKTEAYKNFKDILDLFSSNGKIYDNKGIPIYDGNIQLTYDGGIYLGYFESFNYEDSAELIYRLTFDFSFKIEQTILKMGF